MQEYQMLMNNNHNQSKKLDLDEWNIYKSIKKLKVLRIIGVNIVEVTEPTLIAK